MTTPFLHRSGCVFVCLLLSLTLGSCSLFDTVSDICGPGFDAEDDGFGTSLAAWETFVSGGNRFYRRTLKVENVCPDEHVTASFDMALKEKGATLQLPLSIRGRVEWSLIFPSEEVFLAENLRVADGTYSGQVEAGLKQVFGENPATYFVSFEVFFPTTGVASRDLAYVMDFVDIWRMKTRYFEFPSE